MVHGVHLDHLVMIDEVVERLGAHDDRASYLAVMQGLLLPRHMPRLDHMHHAVGEHLRV